MTFSEPLFAPFFAVVLIAVTAAHGWRARRALLLMASLAFYATWSASLAWLPFTIAGLNAWLGVRILSSPALHTRRRYLLGAAAWNVLLLLLWRLPGAYGASQPGMFGWLPRLMNTLRVCSPVGLGFLTLTGLSFCIDAHRRRFDGPVSWLDALSYMTLVPTLIAGPILRGPVMLGQARQPLRPLRARLQDGGGLFLLGLSKKLLIADRLGTITDPVFADPGLFSGMTVGLAVIAYSLQIYCDFSGYTDMAIAIGRGLGLRLPQNFAAPYLSGSISEFWRRWHMSLSFWLRDYLFLPIGYSTTRRLEALKCSTKTRELINYAFTSLITMSLAGIWHGASWGFLAWGVLHGVALSCHRIWKVRGPRRWALPRLAGVIATFAFVTFSWIPFRVGSIDASWLVLRKIIGVAPGGLLWFPEWLLWCGVAFLVGAAIHHQMIRCCGSAGLTSIKRISAVLGLDILTDSISGSWITLRGTSILEYSLLWIWILVIFVFGAPKVSPFIYAYF